MLTKLRGRALKKNLFFVVLAIIVSIGYPSIVTAEVSSEEFYKTSADLKQVLTENFDAYQKEEIFRVLPTVHTLSPAYKSTKDIASKIFPAYDLNYELVSFKYLLTDDKYAIARVSQKTTKVSGPAFRNNLLDLIVIFKQEKGQWKLWSQIVLEIEFIN